MVKFHKFIILSCFIFTPKASKLHFIMGGCIEASMATRATCGVPLGPNCPQDHARIEAPRKFQFYPDLEPENRKGQNGTYLNLATECQKNFLPF